MGAGRVLAVAWQALRRCGNGRQPLSSWTLSHSRRWPFQLRDKVAMLADRREITEHTGLIALRRSAVGGPEYGTSSSPTRPTIYPPAVCRRIAEAKCDEEFVAQFSELAPHVNAADAATLAELIDLVEQLDELLLDRGRRLLALGQLVPQARDEHDALARAGLTWADTGLPPAFALTSHGCRRSWPRRGGCWRGFWRTRPACRERTRRRLGRFKRHPLPQFGDGER